MLQVTEEQQEQHLFNGHFQHNPGKPVLEHHRSGFDWSKDDGCGGDNCGCKSCEAPVKSSPPVYQRTTFFAGQMPFPSPNQQRQSTKGRKCHISQAYSPPNSTLGIPSLS